MKKRISQHHNQKKYANSKDSARCRQKHAGDHSPSWKKAPNLAAIEREIKAAYGIADTFPDSVQSDVSQLSALTPSEKASLEDLTDLCFVTIDGEDARDFDDAISVEKHEDGWRLLVAIADVSRYVPKIRKSRLQTLDSEAQTRGNSFYFPGSVAPMLPPRLSTDLASLRAQTERPVIVCELLLTDDGFVRKSRFSQARICSQARLSYTQVQGLLLKEDPAVKAKMFNHPRAYDILRMLEAACRLSEILSRQRELRGSLMLRSFEPEYSWNAQGIVTDIHFREHLPSHRLIEEFMILANEACAEHLRRVGLPFLYRIHPEPSEEEIAQLETALHCCGALPAEIRQRALRARDLPVLLRSCKGESHEQTVTSLCLRALPKAIYSPENIGHFGLASPCYCHFTSPIRRYADLLVHRALKYALGCNELLFAHRRLQIVASHLNRQEERAQSAERMLHKYCAILYMREKVGHDFPAYVSTVTQAGFFVQLKNVPVSGFVAKRLFSEAVHVDLLKQRIFNIRTGLSYQLGDPLLVRLIAVVPQTLAINFLPVAAASKQRLR